MTHCKNKPECSDAVCNAPTFTHDCEDCRFLGSVTGPHPRRPFNPYRITYDLWFCERCDGGSVIARYSSEGSHYASSPVEMLHKDSNPALLWARALLQMESIK